MRGEDAGYPDKYARNTMVVGLVSLPFCSSRISRVVVDVDFAAFGVFLDQ